MALSVLFIGGTGQISLPCVELAVKAGHKVSVFNRGIRDEALPKKVKTIQGDMKDPDAYRRLGKSKWDVVAQFMVFTPEQIELDIDTFSRLEAGGSAWVSWPADVEAVARDEPFRPGDGRRGGWHGRRREIEVHPLGCPPDRPPRRRRRD